MRVAIVSTPIYTSKNKQNQAFKAATPREITTAFKELRIKIAELPETGKIKPIIAKCAEDASVVAEHRGGNWILTFIAKLGEQKAEVTHVKGNKNAVLAGLKDPAARKQCYNFFKDNGVPLKGA